MEKPKNNNTILIIVTIVAMLIVAGAGFYMGQKITDYEEALKDNNKPTEKETAPEENQTPVEESTQKEDKIQEEQASTEEQYNVPEKCKSMVEELDFTVGKSSSYCYADMCTTNVDAIIQYINRDVDEKIYCDIDKFELYSFHLENDKISFVKNGEAKKKTTINNISGVKSYRVYFSVQNEHLLYVVDSNNNLYQYYLNLEKNNVSNKKLIYKNVKSFDVFEGNDYPKCVKEALSQNIKIAIYTLDGKFVII